VRFLLELAMLAALAYAGWKLPEQTAAQIVLAVGLPLAAAAVWGTWIAPKATRRQTDPSKLAVELLLFLAAAGGLALSGRPLWGVAIAAAYAVNVALMFAWRQRAY
jgi:uncharacterized membrane protein (DUF4010 family)